MKYLTLFGASVCILAGCSADDQTANKVLDVVQKSELLSKATSVPCGQDGKIGEASFREKCWTRDISEEDIGAIGDESLALGLALQKASSSPFQIVENDNNGFMLMRENTQSDCAHYIQIHFSPQQGLTEPYTMKFEIGVTEKPHCGELDWDAAS